MPATVVLFLIAWSVDGPLSFHIANSSGAALLTLGLIGTCIPVLSLFHLIARQGAQAAALTTFFIPFAAVAIGVGLLGESFPPMALIGLLAVVLGSFLIVRNQMRLRRDRTLTLLGKGNTDDLAVFAQSICSRAVQLSFR